MAKIGRNDPCWCRSGRKYKKCHLGTPADNQRNNMEASLGEFGARSMSQSLKKFYQEKQTGVTIGKDNLNELLNKIMEGKKAGNRPQPSKRLILGKSKFNSRLRRVLVDIVGEIVDQNWCGRSEMCVLFAILLGDALKKLGAVPKIVIGKGVYTNSTREFTWDHAWVLICDEIVDGNVDSMVENPAVPEGVEPNNYWGALDDLPSDRKLTSNKEIDENWIRENTTYEELQLWRKQLYKKMESLKLS